ncbi:MAG: GNAT family N-acetyltransferase [Chloroflexota bacterium]|nr:GNAT family N-acetyltransferase [Chloroflexota bacterium]
MGRELLRWGVERVRGQGAAAVELSVEARNERALGLYERTGFERVEEWPRWSKSV